MAETDTHEVLFDQGEDQESWLRNGAQNKRAGIVEHLKLQLEFEKKLQEVSEDKKLKLSPYIGPFKISFVINSNFSYLNEFKSSVLEGRSSEAFRVARPDEMIEREYIKGSNKAIDNLLDAAQKHIETQLVPENLDQLNCWTNLDSQPSNYFTNGKLNDLDKVFHASSLYMAARLLGHPVVQDLGISNREWFEEYAQLRQLPDEIKDQAFESFEAHIAWIAMYHAVTYECRVQDQEMADKYFAIAMQCKDQELKQAYVNALEQSDLQLLQRNLDVM